MRELTDLFQINGSPIPVPDSRVVLRFADLEAPDSGLDESGTLHRFLLRSRVPGWELRYTLLRDDEMAYLMQLLSQGPDFRFTHPSLDGTVTTVCYCPELELGWEDAAAGLWRDTVLRVKAC